MLDKKNILQVIRRNIQEFGFHIYVVGGESSLPRFAYTIGLRDSIGAELLMPGAIYYAADEVTSIIHSIRRQVTTGEDRKAALQVDGLGVFTLRRAHTTWTRSLMLGALDYYGVPDVGAYQVVPDEQHWTIDVPDTSNEWSGTKEPVWRWLHEAWPYDVPAASTATTNLDALRGAHITELARWGEDEWEMFAGSGTEVPCEEMRVAPLATLLGADSSLMPALDLVVGKGLTREDAERDWMAWGKPDA